MLLALSNVKVFVDCQEGKGRHTQKSMSNIFSNELRTFFDLLHHRSHGGLKRFEFFPRNGPRPLPRSPTYPPLLLQGLSRPHRASPELSTPIYEKQDMSEFWKMTFKRTV
jgi:hypothetical protein